jgi:hypothetical protein
VDVAPVSVDVLVEDQHLLVSQIPTKSTLSGEGRVDHT